MMTILGYGDKVKKQEEKILLISQEDMELAEQMSLVEQ